MKHFISIVTTLITTLSLTAQITISNTDFGVIGDSIFLAEQTTAPSGVNVGGTGNQSWNFSNLSFGNLDTVFYRNPQQTSFGNLFQVATEATVQGEEITYYNNSPISRVIDGVAGDLFGDGNIYAVNYNPDYTILNFPATYQDSFMVTTIIDTTTDTSIVIPPLFNFDSLRIKRVIAINSNIDAYGGVSTPGGSFNSIRQYSVITQIDSLFTHTTGGSWGPAPINPVTTTTEHRYTWYAQNQKYPVLDAVASGAGGNLVSYKFLLGGNMSASIPYFSGPNCFNGNDGFAAVDVVGGTQPYTYQWSPNAGGQTNDTITGLAAGLYSVTVYDALNDSATALINLNQPASAVDIDTVSIIAESSFGNDGAININVNGGASPYNYAWSNNATSQNISGLTTGNYSVTVTDQNNCLDSADFFVPSLAGQLSGQAVLENNASCFSVCDGSAKMVAAGGTLPYTFMWSNNQTDSLATGLCAGTYNVTVYDANGDSATSSISITEPAMLMADTVSVTPESPTGNDGAIDAIVTGGTTPYSYAWSNGDTTQDINSLTTGVYNLTVTDFNGCTDVLSVFVPTTGVSTGITYLSSDFGAIGDVAYYAQDLSLPMVDLTKVGNNNWDFSSLQIGGLDTINFLDPANTSNGSKFSNANLVVARRNDTTYVNKNNSYVASQGLVGDPFGIGFSAAVSFKPELKTLEFPATFGNNFSSTTVIDSTIDTTIQIFDSIRLKSTIIHNSKIDGYGNLNTPSENYDVIRQRTQIIQNDSVWGHNQLTGWQNISTFNSLDTTYLFNWYAKNEPFPVVQVEADDSLGNVKTVSFKLGTNLLATVVSKTDAKCNGDCNGEATVTGLSGQSPYNYYWDANTGNQSGPTAIGLCASTYAVTVVDANMDSVLTTVQINEPLALVVTLNNTTTETDLGNNGAIDINVTGGTPPYNYNWSGTNQTTQDISGLTGGQYNVTVTDFNNCTQTLNVTLNSIVGYDEISKSDIEIFPNPFKYQVNLNLGSINEAAIEVYDVLGNSVYNERITNNLEILDLTKLPKGVYLLLVKSEEGIVKSERLVKH